MQPVIKPHVVVVGAGFGGLQVVRGLKNAPLSVTLVDRNNYHLFQPLLYQVATAGVSANEIAYPLRSTLRNQENAGFCLADVEGIDLEGKKLQTSCGTIDYDYLVLAAGGRTNFYGLDSVAQNAFGLKNLQDAVRIRNHILHQFELANQQTDPDIRRMLLTFVIVGGGPTGVECSGAISELIHLVLRKDYPGLNDQTVRIILVEMMDKLLPAMPASLSEATRRILQDKKNVEVHLNKVVAEYDGDTVTFRDGEKIPAQTLIWAAGIKAASLYDSLDVKKGRAGTILVQPTLQIPGHAEVFAIGDAVYFEQDGSPLPMVAPVAMQQGRYAARNLLGLMRGEPLTNFRYKDPGTMATIGRNQAVAMLGRFHFSGFFAWLAWLVVHIMQLIGFRNRIIVLINWAWDYFFYERAVRIISPE